MNKLEFIQWLSQFPDDTEIRAGILEYSYGEAVITHPRFNPEEHSLFYKQNERLPIDVERGNVSGPSLLLGGYS